MGENQNVDKKESLIESCNTALNYSLQGKAIDGEG